MKKISLFIIASFLLANVAQAQLNVGSATPPVPSAQLQVSGSNKGTLISQVALTALNAAGPITAPATGLLVYNTATAGTAPNEVAPGYYWWNGSQWVALVNATTSTPPTTGWGLTGNAGTTPGTNFIGTTDKKNLVFKANNTMAGIIDIPNLNTAFGIMTGADNESVAIGANALEFSDINNAYYNTAVGSGAIRANSTGYQNTALGAAALASNTIGADNTGLGYGSLNQVTSGQNDIGIGSLALNSLVSGNNNIGIGYLAGSGITSGNNNLVIGSNQNVVSGTAANQLNIKGAIFGTGLTGTVAAPAGNIGIGTAAPSEKLDVAGNIRFSGALMPNNTAGTSGQVLTSAGAGLVPIWANASSGWGLTGNAGTTPGTNFIGTTDAKSLVFKIANIPSGIIDADNGNTALGLNAGSDVESVAFGYEALRHSDLNFASYNVAVGSYTLRANTKGYYNTAVGSAALQLNIEGLGNTGLGNSSLRITSGNNNIGLGSFAGDNLTSGNNNIAIGKSQNLASNTTDNQLNIGGAIFGTGLSGTVAAPAGNIGIGTVDPKQKLDVNGNIKAVIPTYADDAAADADAALPSGSLYKTTVGGRAVFQKP